MTESTRVLRALRCLAGFQLLLMLSTWKLWTRLNDFPTVPLLPISIPALVLPVASAILFLTCLLIVYRPVPNQSTNTTPPGADRRLCGIALIAGLISVLCNQHCLQAWHWLFLVTMLLTITSPANALVPSLRIVICTIYLCSGLSRITTNPQAGVAGMITRQLLNLMAGTGPLDPASVNMVCHSLTLIEIATGCLLFSTSKLPTTLGITLSVLTHVALLLALGPLGLNHHSGVLFWNLCFLALVPILFFNRQSPLAGVPKWPVGAILVGVFSVSGLFGFADNWPSWQLYSSRPESWTLWIHRTDTPQLPRSLQNWLATTSQDNWIPIRLDRLSLQSTGSPIYPEDRFQLAVISEVLRTIPPTLRFRVTIEEPHPLMWWKRSSRELSSRLSIEQQHAEFLLNSRAR